MKNLLTVLGGLALPLAFVAPVLAASPEIGNDVVSRANTDTYSNFVIIDTNNPADVAGDINNFMYYASALEPIRFLLVDGSWSVKWVSEEFTPLALGENTYVLPAPVHVEAGWNVGLYFAETGAIPYDQIGLPVYWRANNSGLPAVDETLSFEGAGTQNRTYSFMAFGDEDEEETDYENHGQYVRSQEDKREAAHSRIGMPEQSRGHLDD